MTIFVEQVTALREPPAMQVPDRPARGVPHPNSRDPCLTRTRLATTVLRHLPLAVAVIDAGSHLLYWNEQAAGLFGIPPLKTADNQPLAAVLAGVANLTPAQRNRIVAFSAANTARGDRTTSDSRLRLSLGHARKIAIEVRGMGGGRWMLIIEEGTPATRARAIGTAPQPAKSVAPGDAWLDLLTGLGNRRHFNQKLQATLDAATADAQHAILLIDLDRFAAINDTLGHTVGDALLRLVAQRLRQETRDNDLLARLGGDEFVILIQNGPRSHTLAARLVEVLSRPFLVDGHIANIGASLGVVQFPDHGASPDDLMRHADLALYDAKSAGRRTWRVFKPAMAAQAKSRRAFETDLRKALALSEFSLAYQAQFNIRTQTVTGFEALLRWNHPTRGSVSPVAFIPVAEDIGCIVELGEWVLKAACEEASRWPDALFVAVNVSPRQLEDSARLFNAVQAALQASGLAPERLELEITESSLLSREAHVLETLHRLRATGIRIAMDDFGTGYSSLSQLLSFPFDKIKIDRSFIAGLDLDSGTAVVVRAISALGSGLGMTTTAEGVETAAQAALVAADGCTDIQGYLIARPIPSSGIESVLLQYCPVQNQEPVPV